jgi:hypothetical protein
MIPPSPAQRQLWFLDRAGLAGHAYKSPLALRLSGVVDVRALEATLGDVVERHESLRTVFPDVDGQPTQRIVPVEQALPVTLSRRQVSAAGLDEALKSASQYQFDLINDLPIRATLFEISPHEHVLLLLMHHIASDGWSLGPLARDLSAAYEARLHGKQPGWPPLPVQYVDYTLWQQELLGNECDPDSLASRQLSYWLEALEGLPGDLPLPTDRPRPATASYRGDRVPLEIDATLHAQLAELARRNQVTVFMVLQAAVAILLTSSGAGTDIPIGATVTGRTDELLNDLIGCFVNTIVLRTDTSGNPSFRELLCRVREFDLRAYENQDLPFERVVEALRPERSLSTHPLYQIGITQHIDMPVTMAGLSRTEVHEFHAGRAKFGLEFNIVERPGDRGGPGGIEGSLEFAVDVFSRTSVERMVQRLVAILSAAAGSPDMAIDDFVEIRSPAASSGNDGKASAS